MRQRASPRIGWFRRHVLYARHTFRHGHDASAGVCAAAGHRVLSGVTAAVDHRLRAHADASANVHLDLADGVLQGGATRLVVSLGRSFFCLEKKANQKTNMTKTKKKEKKHKNKNTNSIKQRTSE